MKSPSLKINNAAWNVSQTSDEFIFQAIASRIIQKEEQSIRFGHQMIDSRFVVVIFIGRVRNLLFFQFNHFPGEHALVVVILQLLIQRINHQLLNVVARQTFKAEHVIQ